MDYVFEKLLELNSFERFRKRVWLCALIGIYKESDLKKSESAYLTSFYSSSLIYLYFLEIGDD